MICAMKIGGSVITDKTRPYTLRLQNIQRISAEIARALKENKDLRLLVGNGGGSFPHEPASKGNISSGIREDWQLKYFAETQNAASELNRILVRELIKNDVLAYSIQPSAAGMTNGGKLLKMHTEHIKKLLELGMVPVVYGDAFVDIHSGSSIVSTEKLLSYIIKRVKTDRVLIGTDKDGVLDEDGQVIKVINMRNFSQIKGLLKGADSTDVTGGMKHKVEAMLELAKFGPDVYIFNATKEGNVYNALKGAEIGTKITA